MKFYTGIGSRQTPSNILNYMFQLASQLETNYKYVLRSGAALGADTAFEDGSKVNEIYIPWIGFNNHKEICINSLEAREIASKHHPYWNRLSEPVKKLMTRSVLQVLGQDLKTYSDFVLCWTPDGCTNQKSRSIKTGGTGLAISVADSYNVPVINMCNQNWIKELEIVVTNSLNKGELT